MTMKKTILTLLKKQTAEFEEFEVNQGVRKGVAVEQGCLT